MSSVRSPAVRHRSPPARPVVTRRSPPEPATLTHPPRRPPGVVVDVSGAPDWLSHDDLLRLARAIQAAAIVDDLYELSRLAKHLRRALRRHVESERISQQPLPAPLRSVVFGGQDRLLRLAESIGHDADGDRECACVRRGAELVVALRRQATLESLALGRSDGEVVSSW